MSLWNRTTRLLSLVALGVWAVAVLACGADMLSRWGLPRSTVSAVRLLCADPAVVNEPLARVLLAAHCLAMDVTEEASHQWSSSPRDGLSLVGIAPSRVDELSTKINVEVDRIAAFIAAVAK